MLLSYLIRVVVHSPSWPSYY